MRKPGGPPCGPSWSLSPPGRVVRPQAGAAPANELALGVRVGPLGHRHRCDTLTIPARRPEERPDVEEPDRPAATPRHPAHAQGITGRQRHRNPKITVGGFSMTLSSHFGRGFDRGEDAVVTKQGPQDIHASAGEGDEGLDVAEALSALLEVEVAVGSLSHR